MRGGLVVLVLVVPGACSSSSSSPPPSPAPPADDFTRARGSEIVQPDRGATSIGKTGTGAPSPTPPPLQPVTPGKVTIQWANMKATDGCFFFSGPSGRDDQLVGDVIVDHLEGGDDIDVKIGTARFHGTYRQHALDLRRTSTYDFNGAWRVTESIEGAFIEGKIRGHYRYNECELATKDCPGRCVIDADVIFQR